MEMRKSHLLVNYLLLFLIVFANVEHVWSGEYHAPYQPYEEKQVEYHHHDYHHPPPPPPPPKKANVDINIPIDFGTMAKIGLLGLTKLKLLMAMGKVAGAGLGVSTLALGQLGKIALSVAPIHKGAGIAIDLSPGHGHKREDKSYEGVDKHRY